MTTGANAPETLERLLAHEFAHAWQDAMGVDINDPDEILSDLRENQAADIENDIMDEAYGEDPRDGYEDTYMFVPERLMQMYDALGNMFGFDDTDGDSDGQSDGGPGGGSGGGDGGGSGGSRGGDGGDGGGDGTGGPKLPRKPGPDDQGSPLIFDIDGDGIELYSVGEYGTYFDLRNNGQATLLYSHSCSNCSISFRC